MSKELVVIPIHGMGATKKTYADKLRQAVRRRLGPARWDKVAWHRVYYQSVMQTNQKQLLRDMRNKAQIDWLRLREFVLYGFSDAAGMEAKPQADNSVYQQIQARMLATLDAAFDEAGDRPVVVIAHSLGCQVFSNYLWDAQRNRNHVTAGIFRPDLSDPVGRRSERDRFRRLKTLRHLFTTGCNIPVFIAGLPKQAIRPVQHNRNGWQFDWHNYYDKDDVLGWPLKPINGRYARAVKADHQINAGRGPAWLSSWTPLSHNAYWEDGDFLDPLENRLKALLS